MLELLRNILISGGSFVLVLGVVVVVHEFGHFQVGRWCGMAVKSFSIGLGPEWFGWTDKHNTRWKISKIPLGGFVSWADDTDPTSTLPAAPETQALSQEEARKRGYFRAMPLWRRALVTAAGPLANFVFSILAFALLAFVAGRDLARIDGVAPNSAAAEAGLQTGDVIVSVDGQEIRSFVRLQEIVAASAGQRLDVVVQRGDEAFSTSLTPRAQEAAEGAAATTGRIGVSHERRPGGSARLSPLESLAEGATQTWDIVAQTGGYLGRVFTGRESGSQIAGPVGIFNVSGQIASSALEQPQAAPWEVFAALALALLWLAAQISVAVGIFNLLPVPVLDGGHLLFYAVEAVRGGRPLPPVAQEWAYRAGFAALASVFLFATWNDIVRLLPGSQG